MNIIISTGCPYSGWDMIVPTLQHAGLAPAGDTFTRWHDELFRATDITDPLQIRQPLQLDPGMAESAGELLSEVPQNSGLLADSRIVWLLNFWATWLPDAQFLLFYTRAETAVAHALLQGVEPLQFLAGWQAANQQLMQFQRRHRRRALLLDAEAASHHPQALINACQLVGIKLETTDKWPVPAPELPMLARFLVSNLFAEQPAVQTLQTELEASAQPLGDVESHVQPQPVELLNSYLQQQAHERKLQQEVYGASKKLEAGERTQLQQAAVQQKLQALLDQSRKAQQALQWKNKEAGEENDLLLLQLLEVQEELETTFLQKQQFEQSNREQGEQRQQLQLQFDGVSKKLAAAEHTQQQQAAAQQKLQVQLEQGRQDQQMLQAKNKEAGEENELLLLQLQLQFDGVSKKLEAAERIQIQQAAAQQKLQVQLEQGRQDQQMLQAKNKEAGEDNELLLLQLHQVQEALKHYYLNYQESRRELSARESEIEEQRQCLTAMKQTISWKITALARALAKPFKGSNKAQKLMKIQVRLLKKSGLFDEEWYLAEYTDVASAGVVDPVTHYLRYGAAEGRNPSPHFDTRFYLESHPDVAAAGVNPLVHFVKFGKEEGRKPSRQGGAL